MKMSRIFGSTLRNVPAEIEEEGYKLLLRAGMIRKAYPGIYNYLPLGYRVIKKVKKLIRAKIENLDMQEIHTATFKLENQSAADFFMEVASNEIKSYKQLPLNIYQFNTTYNGEGKSKLGLLDSKESIIQNGCSFDTDEGNSRSSYVKIHEAYSQILNELKLDFLIIEGHGNAEFHEKWHQFVVEHEMGETSIARCCSCGYTVNAENAVCGSQDDGRKEKNDEHSTLKELEEIKTPNIKTISQLESFLKIPSNRLVKTLLFTVGNETVAALVRGDRELNSVKLARVLNIPVGELGFATEEEVKRITNAEVGFAGPVDLKGVKIIADQEVAKMRDFIVGANKTDYHLMNVNIGRDFTVDGIADIRFLQPGDICVKCSHPLEFTKGIKIGEIRQYGTEISNKRKGTYVDEAGIEKPLVQNYYSLNLSRLMGAVVEQHHDDNGIIWPVSISPYAVVVDIISIKNQQQVELSEKIASLLHRQGVDVLVDDRNESAGVKFNDADLLGIPIRIVVGKKASEGVVEYKERNSDLKVELTIEEAIERIVETFA